MEENQLEFLSQEKEEKKLKMKKIIGNKYT